VVDVGGIARLLAWRLNGEAPSRSSQFSASATLPLGEQIHGAASSIQEQAPTMRIPLLTTYTFLAYAFSVASATALTYKLAPNEKACFFTFVEQRNAKVAFYFAVSLLNGLARPVFCRDFVEEANRCAAGPIRGLVRYRL